MKESDFRIARIFGLNDKILRLQNELLTIPHAVEIEFDLSGFLDNLNQVIILVGYAISVKEKHYFQLRNRLLMDVERICANNGLFRTEDKIEDYGAHFYFVMKCDKSWRIKNE